MKRGSSAAEDEEKEGEEKTRMEKRQSGEEESRYNERESERRGGE